MPSGKDEYALAAPFYDALTARALNPMRRELAELAACAMPGLALDACCGTGRQCLLLAKSGRQSAGLDLSPAMLARARRLRDSSPPEHRFLLVRGDASRLPFQNETFAFACVCRALHEKPPSLRPAILAELIRVTAAGGTLAILDYITPATPARRALSLGVKTIERLAGREHHEHYAHFMSHGGLEGFLDGQGLAPQKLSRRFFGLMGLAVLTRPAQTK